MDRLNQELEREGLFQGTFGQRSGTKICGGRNFEWWPIQIVTTWNICQVAVGPDKTVQTVAGAPNAQVGLKTIVVPGAMMDGSLIFPGPFRGEKVMA